MNIYEVVFLLGLSGMLVCVGFKVWNVLNLGEVFDWRKSTMFFLGGLVSWFGVLVSMLFKVVEEKLIYLQLFRFSSGLLVLSIMVFLVEIFLFARAGVKPVVEARNSRAVKAKDLYVIR